MFSSLTPIRGKGWIIAGVGTFLMFIALVPCTNLFGQAPKQQSEEWDAVESGLVDMLARGNQTLRKYPAIQIVSPPLVLDGSNPEGVQHALVQLADSIPEWSPYFRPSGRSVRQEFGAFIDALKNPVSLPGGAPQSVTSDDTAYRFNPDIAELTQKGTSIAPAGTVKWEVQSGSGSAGTTKSSKRVRIRIGPLVGRGSSSTREDDLDAVQADGTFSADGLLVVNIMPGAWFSSRAIDRFGKGPFKTGDPSQWWGPSGHFALYPRSLIVARQPSFSLKLDARAYQRVKLAVAGGATIAVGPFRLSKSRSGSAEFKFDDSQNTVFAKQADEDVVIAVMNHLNESP
jgi:hypothetical protein